MTIREPSLPPGWYPPGAPGITRFLEPWKTRRSAGLAALSPHAGWRYSGALAAAAFSSLDGGADTAAILGGHLAAGSPVLAFTEDAVRTPLGLMDIDRELRDALCSALSGEGLSPGWAQDQYRDNTVEALVPMARFFFPRARLVALRLPADMSSFETGRKIAEIAGNLGRKLVVAGSTDLTHYGPNYGFSPRGTGKEALAWARENDRRFIEAVLSGDPGAVLRRAEEELSACSAGAALGVLGFVSGAGSGRPGQASAAPPVPELLAYSTSAGESGDIPASFVGYAAVSWK